MFGFLVSPRKRNRRAGDYWLAGQFGPMSQIEAARAEAAWSEYLGRESAQLWLAARANEGRGR